MSSDSTAEFQARYLQWRDTYGLLSACVTELRELIIKASHHEWLTQQQRDELLALVGQIDSERAFIDAPVATVTESHVISG